MTKLFRKVEAAIQGIECTIQGETVRLDEAWQRIVEVYRDTKAEGRRAYFVGNGGSAAIAMHMSSDFFKNGGVRTQSMHDSALMTCLANDFGYEFVFSKQIELVAEPKDVLTAISSSGNSANILTAVNAGRERGCKVLTLSGFRENNALRQTGDINLYVPSCTYGIVETIHNMILQQIVDDIVETDGVGMKRGR